MSKSWGTLRAEMRLLEHETETLLSKKPSEADLDSLLSQRRDVLEQLAKALDQQNVKGNKAQHLERHREVLAEHEASARGVIQRLREQSDRENLLGNVDADIRRHKASLATGSAGGEEAYMLNERDRIESSHSMTDAVLAQAYATRDEFNLQRLSLQNIGQRLSASADRIPGMNSLLSKINTRQKRNSVILAVVIAFCILILFFT
ncbi:protein transport protein gos1 [Savitreella phatthalungensis]